MILYYQIVAGARDWERKPSGRAKRRFAEIDRQNTEHTTPANRRDVRLLFDYRTAPDGSQTSAGAEYQLDDDDAAWLIDHARYYEDDKRPWAVPYMIGFTRPEDYLNYAVIRVAGEPGKTLAGVKTSEDVGHGETCSFRMPARMPHAIRRDMKIIACNIFHREIEAVAPEIASQVSWLPAGLHTDLGRLKEALERAMEGDGHVACIYGTACHPDMEELVAAHRGHCLPVEDCVTAFLSDEERRKLHRRKAFVMTPGWLRNWREFFREGLGWEDVDARQNFGLYDVVVLLDFGLESIDDLDVLEFFDYVRTVVEIVPTDLTYFRENVKRLLETAACRRNAGHLDP